MAHVLVIDDDDILGSAIQRVLTLEGHRVDLARDGAAGLQRVLEERPDLVITDIIMPAKDGIVVIQSLVHRSPPIPVIAMSGGGMTSARSLLTDAGLFGAVRTIAKPFEMGALLAAVSEVLDEA